MKSLTKLAILAGAAGGILYGAARKNVLQISPEKIKEKAKDFSEKISTEALSGDSKAAEVISSSIDKATQLGRDLKDGAQQFVEENINPDGPLAHSLDGLKETLISKLNDLENTEIPFEWMNVVKSYEKCLEDGSIEDLPKIGSLKLNHDELVSQFTLWAFLGGALNIESNVEPDEDKEKANERISDLINITSNEDVIKIKEDIGASSLKRIKSDDFEDIILKPLNDDEFAICMLNKTDEARIVEINLKEILKDSESYEVYDLFTKESFPIKDDLLKYVLPHGTRAFRIKA